MLVAALRQRILELAIQGKLVPQSPDDGNAEELYQQIQQEKKKLIAAGKLKKQKPLPPITQEEIPFDIPETWKWVRLPDVVYGVGDKANQILAKEVKKEGAYPAVSQGQELIDGYTDKSEKVIRDLPLVMFGDHTRNVKFVDFPFVISADGTKFMKAICIEPEYLYYWVTFAALQLRNRGYARHFTQLKAKLVPLPPLPEQRRIMEKAHVLFAQLDAIEQSQERVAAIRAELNKRIHERAIQGKLVPQRSEDGTAEELYQQIQREKKKLIAAGKLKKEKPLRTITEEEIPFDIPESWKWVRLGECTTYGQAKQKATPDQIEDDTWCLELEDIERDSARILQRLKVGERPIKGDRAVFKRGNVLFSKLRPYLHKILVADADGVCTTELVPFSCYNGILPEYMVLVLMSPCIDRRICGTSYGVKMPRVGTADMLSLPVPLPPTDEQKRIVDMVKICRC